MKVPVEEANLFFKYNMGTAILRQSAAPNPTEYQIS